MHAHALSHLNHFYLTPHHTRAAARGRLYGSATNFGCWTVRPLTCRVHPRRNARLPTIIN